MSNWFKKQITKTVVTLSELGKSILRYFAERTVSMFKTFFAKRLSQCDSARWLRVFRLWGSFFIAYLGCKKNSATKLGKKIKNDLITLKLIQKYA